MNVLDMMLFQDKYGFFDIRCDGVLVTEEEKVSPARVLRCEERRQEILKIMPYRVTYYAPSKNLIGCTSAEEIAS